MRKFLVCLALAMASLVGAVAVVSADDAATAPATPAPTPALTPAQQAKADGNVPVDLPVLISPKGMNEVITANDLVEQSFPTKKVKGDMIRDSNQIIGMAAKRDLQAGQPIRLIDLIKEQLVQRGEDVTLTYHTGTLEITASGKALESGALGDTIKVNNLGSNRTVDATITGPKQVKITE